MNTEQERAFIVWRDNHDPRKYPAERDAFMAGWDAGRAALQSQDQEDAERYRRPSWAGVTVWVGDRQKTHAITKQEFECCKIDVLQAAFDHARRVEGDV